MAATEGILFGDLFITDPDYFINFFAEYYEENKALLDPVIEELQAVLTKYTSKNITADMAEDFKAAWHRFQQMVLLNDTDLQLLVAYRGASGKNATFSKILKQAEVEGVAMTPYGRQYGIMAGDNLVRESMAALQASKVEQFLQIHLNDFLNQLESNISRPDAAKIHRYHEYCLANYLQNTELSIVDMKWREAFYSQNAGHYFGGQGLGQAYDAFMNHMADREKWVYDYLANGGVSNFGELPSSVLHNDTSVYIEEGGVEEHGHYPQLLRDSTNHIGWYTGGDIVIVDPVTMRVVYNIQLKTTTANKASVFGERVQQIRKFLVGFSELTPKEKGEKIFKFFLTEVSNREDFNNAPMQDIEYLTRELNNKRLQVTMPM